MEKDLLPWILGGALITTGAIAAAIQFTGHAPNGARALPASLASNTVVVAPTSIAPASASAAVPASAPQGPAARASTINVASPEASAKNGPELPPGEVWQCIVNGEKIFSDKRCGDGASVRQISDLNVMDVPAGPPQGSYGAYRSGYGAGPYPSAPTYPDDEDDTGNVASDVYPGQIIVARERARREHQNHQDSHSRPPSRGAAGPHNPR
jgi:hypothetical protein